MEKIFPIGVSDFQEIITGNYYYIDKSLFIKDVIEDGAKVILLPRPRRFGKTLNISMLKYFYGSKDSVSLFQKLKIKEYKHIMDKQGKYPVIYLTFKDEKHSTWENCKKGFTMLFSNLYLQYDYLLNSDALSDVEKKNFNSILHEEAELVEVAKSLLNLSSYLYKYHNQKVVILIDEYDVPIQEGYTKGYYNQIIEFMRNLLSGGLKDNIYLEKAVLTGILRVAEESIFSGLNNLRVCTLLNSRYSNYFGFLEEEVDDMLNYYGIKSQKSEIKKWYNGYVFGNNVIYNPWSVLNYAKEFNEGFRPYWVNSSGNDLIKSILAKANDTTKKEFEDLIQGKSIHKQIHENILINEVDKDSENIWSFLLFSGYLKAVNQKLKEGIIYCYLQIPNFEVLTLYKKIIVSWFKDNIGNEKFLFMLKSLISGDMETFELLLGECITKSVSYFDIGNESEKFYHAFVLGMLISLNEDYEISSNRESGYGRYDIMLKPKKNTLPGIIIEFKKVNTVRNETLEIAVKKALEQIEQKKYKQQLLELNIKDIMEVGIAFEGREVLVKRKE